MSVLNEKSLFLDSKQYDKLDENRKLDALVESLRSKKGHELLNNLIDAHELPEDEYIVHMDLSKKRVIDLLHAYGVSTDKKRGKRDEDIIDMINGTFKTYISYSEKKNKNRRSKYTEEELLAFHLLYGDISTEHNWSKFQKEMSSL